jgi:hypothetical protein
VPNRVKVEWSKAEGTDHPTVTLVQNLRPAENQGTVSGKVVAKLENSWIEIKPTEGPLRRYVPRWLGGNDGGNDQVAGDLIHEAEVGSDVNATWFYDERIRLVSLTKLGGEQPNPQPEPEIGMVEGILLGKGANNGWLEVRPDGKANAGKLLVPHELVNDVSHLYVPNRVKVQWSKAEGADHATATAVHNLRTRERSRARSWPSPTTSGSRSSRPMVRFADISPAGRGGFQTKAEDST